MKLRLVAQGGAPCAFVQPLRRGVVPGDILFRIRGQPNCEWRALKNFAAGESCCVLWEMIEVAVKSMGSCLRASRGSVITKLIGCPGPDKGVLFAVLRAPRSFASADQGTPCDRIEGGKGKFRICRSPRVLDSLVVVVSGLRRPCFSQE